MARRNDSRERGKMIYVPRIVIEEVESIQLENDISSRSSAFEKMVKHSRVGRASKSVDALDIFRGPKKKKQRSMFDGLI